MNPHVPIPEPIPSASPPRPPLPSALADVPPVARWRWWVSLIIIASLPILASLSGLLRTSRRGGETAMLPANVPGLLWYCAVQMGVFGALWGVSWAFSRADRDQLFLRYRGAKSLLWSVGYSVLMRVGLAIAAFAILVLLGMLGFDLKAMLETVQSNSKGIKQAFGPAFSSRDPLYLFLLISLISFVVAGLREELWRCATMAGLFHLAPKNWTQNRKNGVSLGVSSVIFGLGHGYQGITGVLGTTLLGVALGAIVLRHRSIWPAVVAHGCFDAASFALLAAMSAAK